MLVSSFFNPINSSVENLASAPPSSRLKLTQGKEDLPPDHSGEIKDSSIGNPSIKLSPASVSVALTAVNAAAVRPERARTPRHMR